MSFDVRHVDHNAEDAAILQRVIGIKKAGYWRIVAGINNCHDVVERKSHTRIRFYGQKSGNDGPRTLIRLDQSWGAYPAGGKERFGDGEFFIPEQAGRREGGRVDLDCLVTKRRNVKERHQTNPEKPQHHDPLGEITYRKRASDRILESRQRHIGVVARSSRAGGGFQGRLLLKYPRDRPAECKEGGGAMQ